MRAMPSSVRLGLLVVAALVVAWAAPFSATSSAAPGLLSAAPAGQAPPDVQADATVVRSRYVTIDVDALSHALERSPVFREPPLLLELFADRSVVAVFDRFDPNPGGVTWVGHVEGVALSTVTLVSGGGLLTANIRLPDVEYTIRPVPSAAGLTNPQADGRAVHVVSQLDQGAFLPEAPPIEVRLTAEDVAAAAGAPLADTGDVIDVMVVYTPTAMAHAGGSAGIVNLINVAVSETNTSYANSDITQRLRLVHTAEVPYTEVSSFSTNLRNLRLGLGALNGVPALRDAYRADLVAMLVHPPSPSACGVAYVMTNVSTAFAPYGVSVTDTNCVAGLTFAHELGHNMGAHHDWYVSTATSPYGYAHGYVNPAVGQRWRTIMAYNTLCRDQGFSCRRVLYWSNPGMPYLPYCTTLGFNCAQLKFWYFPAAAMGIPRGTSTSCQKGDLSNPGCDADNHLVLNNTALTIANLRERMPAGSLPPAEFECTDRTAGDPAGRRGPC
jgi:hypothetical protein